MHIGAVQLVPGRGLLVPERADPEIRDATSCATTMLSVARPGIAAIRPSRSANGGEIQGKEDDAAETCRISNPAVKRLVAATTRAGGGSDAHIVVAVCGGSLRAIGGTNAMSSAVVLSTPMTVAPSGIAAVGGCETTL
jgi:hypothetical protein